MILGILGVGHLAETVLKGLLRNGADPAGIVLAPRGKGPALAAGHGFALARDNADLVARCDVVLLAVRPAVAAEAVAGLPWRAGQLLLSACAGVPAGDLPAAPAQVVRIMPLTASAIGASPTLVCPPDRRAMALMAQLGPAVPIATEAQFETATVSAAIYGWVQMLVQESALWSQHHGLPPETARQLVARTFVAAGRMVDEQAAPMAELLADLATPGGITEAGLDHLKAEGVPQAWSGACDTVLERLRGS
ncbi:hypothetical protein GR170_08875 [Pseudooceanicola sp. GBMRC 2024]|uniref:Pyrroline-5-carboxylate reductase n=1 Tax=Pseudooceanicola albus TaxID=2692189 RepID=A0A6L7G395_9RHOB|nr:pyrroline-5-carboxylate reductase dimerization domain-containing protein [Pseudooceanicola albus]MXN17947.1 hypothetical protein [Pseudooceanicola albus]